MKPYYDHKGITIYCGHCVMDVLPLEADVILTDPPYGIDYHSGHGSTEWGDGAIQGDQTKLLRDVALFKCGEIPKLVFGSYKVPAPAETRMTLVWDTKGALGMGALDLPWKPSWSLIHVIGKGFKGKRTSGVLQCAPVQSMARNGRLHPMQKPVPLLVMLLKKCPPGRVLDPFMGSGSTLVAAKQEGRKAIGIEIEEKYCEIAAKRLDQEVLW